MLLLSLKLVTIDYTGNVKVNIVWVKVGEPVLMDVAFTVTPTTNVKDGSKWKATSTFEAFKVPANTAKYTISLEVGESNHQVPVSFDETNEELKNINSSDILELYGSDKKTPTTDIAKVAYAKFVGELNLQIMREDKEYTGVIKFYNAEGTYLGSNTLSVKKVLPTVIPAGLTAKTGVIHSDGTMPIYPKPMSDSKGEFELSQAFIISTELVNDENLVFNTPSFLYSDSDKNNDIANYASTGRKIENIASAQIGKDTKYPTTVTYDYGDQNQKLSIHKTNLLLLIMQQIRSM